MSSYRTYEEWKLRWFSKKYLPRTGSYRTYEEWKPKIKGIDISKGALFLPYLWGMETPLHPLRWCWDRPFLPYLWGMETELGDDNQVTRPPVLTVPMRNGNEVLEVFETKSHLAFLPYLWGMETWYCFLIYFWDLGSYRTYEEWKPDEHDSPPPLSCKFLPYLWGMETFYLLKTKLFEYLVLTVPMRNGNLSLTHHNKCHYRVLTVPMRNGNMHLSEASQLQYMFLPYLWGMETLKWNPILTIMYTFLPYLWGMETSKPPQKHHHQ